MCGHRDQDEAQGSTEAATLVVAAPDERVTDRERERAIDQLRLHVGRGRLTLEEFGDRVDVALEARTGSALAHALRELPRERSAEEWRARRRAAVTPFALFAVGIVLLWALTGFGFPWPVFPLLGWGLPVLGEWRGLKAREVELV